MSRDLRQEWETPEDFFGVVDRELNFQIDVCATKTNAKCDMYHSLYDDGIDALKNGTPWFSPKEGILRAWCNPGFKDPYPWMKKAYRESQRCPGSVVCVLGIPSFPAAWWTEWANLATEIRLIGGRRIQFIPAPGIKSSSNTRTNCLFIFRSGKLSIPPHIWTWDWTS